MSPATSGCRTSGAVSARASCRTREAVGIGVRPSIPPRQRSLHAASRDYDQAVLTLSAGTLALSVTFAHDITPTPLAGSESYLLFAWGALVISLISIVASFLTSQRVLRDTIASIHREEEPVFGGLARLTTALGWIAGIGLVVGLVLLGLYALANL